MWKTLLELLRAVSTSIAGWVQTALTEKLPWHVKVKLVFFLASVVVALYYALAVLLRTPQNAITPEAFIGSVFLHAGVFLVAVMKQYKDWRKRSRRRKRLPTDH